MSEWSDFLQRMKAPISLNDIPESCRRIAKAKAHGYGLVYDFQPAGQHLKDLRVIAEAWLAGCLPESPLHPNGEPKQ